MSGQVNAGQIIGAASMMRDAQIRYFQYRNPETLRVARELERVLDKMLAAWFEQVRQGPQQKLFPEDDRALSGDRNDA